MRSINVVEKFRTSGGLILTFHAGGQHYATGDIVSDGHKEYEILSFIYPCNPERDFSLIDALVRAL